MTPDGWTHLRKYSPARIAIGRAGASMPTRERLDFQLAQARARDAVWLPFDTIALAAALEQLQPGVVVLTSAATDRGSYLRRPDWGRRLAEAEREKLARARERGPWDLAVVVSDGLSARATQEQAGRLLALLLPALRSAGWRVAPLVVVANARVALQDEVGSALAATVSLMLLGERPGLGSPDSLGAYLVFGPGPGKTDADRNCVSNIRPAGLAPERAAEKLLYLLGEMRRRRLSGVELKEEMPGLDRRVEFAG